MAISDSFDNQDLHPKTNTTPGSHRGTVDLIEIYFGATFYFVLLLFGTFGNIVGIIVIRSTRAMHTSRGVFTALAIGDTVALWINPPRYWIRFVFSVDLRTTGDAACKLHTFASYSARDCATWILVLLTFERFLFAFMPHKSRLLWKARRKILVWTVLMSVLLLKNCPVIWKLHLIFNELDRAMCDTRDKQFRIGFFYLDISVYSLIPSALLLVFNISLLRVLHRARDHRLSLSEQPATGVPGCSVGSTTTKAHRTTMEKSLNQANRLLIPVSMFHLLTSMPLCVFSIVEASGDLKHTKDNSQANLIYALGSFFTMLTACNNGANCIIYFLSSRGFRARLRRILRSAFTLRGGCRRQKLGRGGLRPTVPLLPMPPGGNIVAVQPALPDAEGI